MRCLVRSTKLSWLLIAPFALACAGKDDDGDAADGDTTDDSADADDTDDTSDDSTIPWGEDETVECEVTLQDLAAYVEPEVDHGYPGAPPPGPSCSAGFEPEPRVECADALCWCSPTCEPGCDGVSVCAQSGAGNSCACHPAYEGAAGACQWASVVANESFVGCDDWQFIHGGDNPALGVLEIVGQRAHLGLSAPCQMVAVQAIGRLPDQAEFGDGAALVFDASRDGAANVFVTIAGTRTDLTLDSEPTTQRICVPLAAPKLVNVAFAIEAFGVCADPINAGLWIDQVRLEADSDCG